MRKKSIVVFIVLFLLAAGVAAGYMKIGLHYKDHFFEKTTINGIEVSSMTLAKAEQLIAKQAEEYSLTVQTRDGGTEQILGNEIGYHYVSDGSVQALLEGQNYLAWLEKWFASPDSYTVETVAAYDTEKLKQRISTMQCMNPETIIPPQDAKLEQQEDGHYLVKDEVQGTQLNADTVLTKMEEAVQTGNTVLNLGDAGCYVAPAVTADKGKLQAEAAIRNQYADMKITCYMGGDVTEVLDQKVFGDWYTLDENLQVSFDKEQVKNWVAGFAARYDTIGTMETFYTSMGETVSVEARTYGWQMNQEEETEAIYQLLLAGQSAEHSPSWYESARSRGDNDLGRTYVEIDYTNQHMWFYIDGALIVDTPVVTGNVSKGTSSPEGIFCLVGKEENAVLVGEDYKTPVEYWMPFFGGVGIHDADSWRTEYGGTIYQWGGSHGCINTPTRNAAIIYQNIEPGTPIICYSSGTDYAFQTMTVDGSWAQNPSGDEDIIIIGEEGQMIDVTTEDYFNIPADDQSTDWNNNWEPVWDDTTTWSDQPSDQTNWGDNIDIVIY